jgi:archaeosine synthase beta-subunit
MDPEVRSIIEQCRGRCRKRPPEGTGLRTWSQKEPFEGCQIEAFNIVLRTRGCRWYGSSGCSMCGYSNDSASTGEDPDIPKQLTEAAARYSGQPVIKVFTSGSFFDPQEVTASEREAVLAFVKGALNTDHTKLIVESRPEFVSRDVLGTTTGQLGDIRLEVAIGLESSNDKVLRGSINKGFDFKAYMDAASIIRDAGALLKTYLLLKPPFLTEQQAIDDMVGSMGDVYGTGLSQTISINPMNVQKFTLVEYLYERGEYRPPWLWSVVKVLQKAKEICKNDIWILCHPSGGGKSRGPHNCGKCDHLVLEAIDDFNLTNGPDAFDGLECECRDTYNSELLEHQ